MQLEGILTAYLVGRLKFELTCGLNSMISKCQENSGFGKEPKGIIPRGNCSDRYLELESCSDGNIFHISICLLGREQKVDGSWRMAVDWCNQKWLQLQLLFQMHSLYWSRASQPLASGMQLLPYQVFYSIAIFKVHQKHFIFTGKDQQCTFTVLPMGHVISPLTWYST